MKQDDIFNNNLLRDFFSKVSDNELNRMIEAVEKAVPETVMEDE